MREVFKLDYVQLVEGLLSTFHWIDELSLGYREHREHLEATEVHVRAAHDNLFGTTIGTWLGWILYEYLARTECVCFISMLACSLVDYHYPVKDHSESFLFRVPFLLCISIERRIHSLKAIRLILQLQYCLGEHIGLVSSFLTAGLTG